MRHAFSSFVSEDGGSIFRRNMGNELPHWTMLLYKVYLTRVRLSPPWICYHPIGSGIEIRYTRDFPHPSRPDLGSIQPFVQKVPGLFFGGKAAGAWRCPSTLCNSEVQERVELYICSSSGISWSGRVNFIFYLHLSLRFELAYFVWKLQWHYRLCTSKFCSL